MVKPEGLGEYLNITGHRMISKTLEPINIFMSVPEAELSRLEFASLCTISKSSCGRESCLAFWYFYLQVCTDMLGRLFRWQRKKPGNSLGGNLTQKAHEFTCQPLGTGSYDLEKWISLTRNCSKWLKSKRELRILWFSKVCLTAMKQFALSGTTAGQEHTFNWKGDPLHSSFFIALASSSCWAGTCGKTQPWFLACGFSCYFTPKRTQQAKHDTSLVFSHLKQAVIFF